MTSVANKPSRRRTGETRNAILRLAQQLIEQRGYNTFSYRDISTQLGIKNAAIHYYFKCKADLGEAVIENYRQAFAEWSKEVEEASDNAWNWLNAYFNVYAEILSGETLSIFSNGVLSAEFQSLPECLQERIRLMLRERYDWLIRTMRLGRERDQLHFSGTPETKALEIAAATQGALQISMVVALGTERFHQVVEQIRHDLNPTP